MSFFIVSTPIGNLGDLSIRAIDVLSSSNIIICEKKNKALKLISHLKINKVRLISYHESRLKNIFPEIIKCLKESKKISFISDAGTPLISDPGSLLIKELIDNNIEPIVVPGSSASLTALVISGFNTDKFIFHGFLPKSVSRLKNEIDNILCINIPVIFYVNKNDINKIFSIYQFDTQEIYFSLSKELTKKFEKTIRGKITDIDISKIKSFISKGEFVLILYKPNKDKDLNIEKIKKRIKELKIKSLTKKAISEKIKNEFELKKNQSYKLTLEFYD
ncbi:16S rRNA (cytidine(1402)-2'-O)-methyltransferase [bacterium]|nr:16S rRNA (cytidine(1402)-2'-O)-methyltransferase [bacterium]|tara:strand:+ start:1299 stop:2126 length:828 start_codon:yes stop_codon:yes gene_type:complete